VLEQTRGDILVERLAAGARLLGPIQHAERADGLGQRRCEGRGIERPVQTHLQHTDALAVCVEVFHRFVNRVGARAHRHDHAIRVRRADVVEELVRSTNELSVPVHDPLYDPGAFAVVRVDRLARLEEHVGVLRGAAKHRSLRIHAAPAVGQHELVVNHGAKVVVTRKFELEHLVRRSEAVEKVHERNPRLERGGVGDGGQIRNLLRVTRCHHGEAGGSSRHHVAVVAEDRQRVRRHRAGRNVEDRRRQLTRDLEHVGDHQQQALRRRESRRQGPGLQGAVNGACGAAFALHLRHARHGPPDVGHLLGRPLIGELTHRRTRRDRVNRDHLAEPVGDVRGGLVAVNRHNLSTHGATSSSCCRNATATVLCEHRVRV